MKFQEILTTFTLAILTTAALQYFFGPYRSASDTCPQTVAEGGRMTAPEVSAPLYGPLKKEVGFDAPFAADKAELTIIETPLGTYTFSTYGGVLEKVVLNREDRAGQCATPLVTLSTDYPAEQERKCFLVALEEETPAYYTLIERHDLPDTSLLVYRAESAQGAIDKTFTIHKNTYAVDLKLTFEPAAGLTMRPRIMLPAPHIKGLTTTEMVQGIISPSGAISSLTIAPEVLKDFWVKPSIFGIQDRYFIHSLLKDEPRFVERGYFSINDLEYGEAILEGAPITSATTIDLHFYMGPKKEEAIKAVDERLLPLLSSGWFAPITRPLNNLLLKLLHALYELVHNYGIAIILVTLLIKLLMAPFTFRSEQGIKERAEFQRKMQYLQEKYKHDKQALAGAQAELIRKNGLSGLGSCLPNLLQLPFFIVLGSVISNSIELYKAPFLWINDLSAPDPYYILPLLVGGSMLASPVTGMDPKQRISMIIAALLFSAFSTKLAAGLVLYIATNTLFSILQAYIGRMFAK